MLAAHQHQIARLNTLTEELVKALQSFQATITPNPQPPPAAALPSGVPAAAAAASGPRLALPEKYDGSPAKCFSLQEEKVTWKKSLTQYQVLSR
ncbi:hypothetical protein Q8A67_022820 [Cirrhinus molitorella]|uniref:Uncharacterized protein n=1 Tax=Cirrhinus molitorella TaxID=172907 RepID=A0AA88P7G7_9TELE|nr:hypothetical protein Q8A67_022820 [Cirrhinus molitorella]